MDPKSILNSTNLPIILDDFVENLIDSCLMDGILAMHRAIKLGYFHVVAPEPSTEDDRSGGDWDSCSAQRRNVGSSGHSTARDNSAKSSSGGCCRCVKCHAKVAATRFAVHLSNCMGLGRNSSRRANKRIAEQQRLEDYAELDDDFDYEEEEDSRQTLPTRQSLQSSASEPALRLNPSTATPNSSSKQYSPLKLTISLVPNANGRSDLSAKHVIRAVNGEPINNTNEMAQNVPSESPKKIQKMALADRTRRADGSLLCKQSKVGLIKQDCVSYGKDAN